MMPAPAALAVTVVSTKKLTASRARTNNMLILCTLIVIVSNSILSVDAIRCHQCNSHFDPECAALSIPKAVKGEKFLKDCNESYDGHIPFCRKTTVTIEKTEEYRVVRSCGWLDTSKNRTDRCFNADNEGYLEVICSCYTEGCNSAPFGVKRFSLFSIVVGLILSFLMRFV